MKRFVFLDIDGVVNHDDWYYKNRVVEKNFKCGDCDPATIERLNRLKELDAKIVISSSWGEMADNMLINCGLELPIIGHTKLFYESWICRGNEVAKWLSENVIKEHIDDEYSYVIFDDDKDFMISQLDNFVHIDREHGLHDWHIDKAIEILNVPASKSLIFPK